MKKIIAFLLGILCVAAMGACELPFGNVDGTSNGSNVESTQSEQTSEHVHTFKRVSERKATCSKEGNITYWTCEECGTYYADAEGENEIAAEDIVMATIPHTLKKTEGLEATCLSKGKREYWTCSVCTKMFADETCTEELTKSQISLDRAPHDMTHHEEVPVDGKENGRKEYWTCNDCLYNFWDANGNEKISNADDLIVYSLLNIPNFIVEVPENRDPVVLQLTDTQIIDAGQTSAGLGGILPQIWATDKMEERCYKYLRETITATNPDFIIITGDIVYGKYDIDGSALVKFVEFMESFQIPWSPIFGNHDNESAMGVNWQCEQFKNAKYCLFEQNTVTGNGNYSVGIVQGGEIKRVFYMMDTNYCGSASTATVNGNNHTKTNVLGFQQDQIDWYTKQITALKEASPDTKISFAYHIQANIFTEAYSEYGYDPTDKNTYVNIDTYEGKKDGDFGNLGNGWSSNWDTNNAIFNGMKALGVDSIFVGHEHEINASVVYDGVRFQFGLKSTEYDYYPQMYEGELIGADWQKGTSLVGGSVIVLSKEDGVIKDAYNYYCDDAGDIVTNGKINWDKI